MDRYPLLKRIDSPKDLKCLNIDELKQLAEEIRQFLLEKVSRTGGHLASNLGVVELTIALHYVFNSPFDKIIWDVGHQAYVHKILTGRREQFDSLRQFGGLSGFPKRSESVHDVFDTGHSSTSISAALGMARARDLKNEKYSVVAVIGDGALTGGMAFEALNDAGHSKTNLMVVLNDNEMSISENVGALAAYLSKLRSNPRYTRVKKGIDSLVRKIPWVGQYSANLIERFKNSFKYLVISGMFFEQMGFTYIGPIDGHNLAALIDVMKRATMVEGPVFIHVVTKKGKGYAFAEKKPELFHGVPPFDVQSGEISAKGEVTFSQAFGQHLVEMAQRDPRIVAITAAMPEGTGLVEFKKRFPNRFFDVGIAEQHAVTMAAGLAANGFRPYVAIYSTFLQRAYDQILHDVCLQNLPVVLAVDRAGIVGEDGETHQGVFDISYLRHIPNITVMAPKNIDELKEMLDYSLTMEGPVAIRYPKGNTGIDNIFPAKPLEGLKWETMVNGSDCCIFSFGRMLKVALEVASILRRDGISARVINARIIKPLDEQLLMDISNRINKWITLEDTVIQGGFGSSINEFVAAHQLPVSVMNLGVGDRFVPHGSVERLLRQLGLDSNSVAFKVKKFLSGYRKRAYVNF
ncbi:1-deoxy-D-xylulose-5-phosphate synthase [Caldicoprobacter faecalis]|uniref:1-deoxy-D-xylulose-5-phosphate synthase n=1 Tax=Caldicoprobacter faecalis TaxID=937334 RepID=A0A1I5U8B4_9FIRM|nr:1-deoxy-D-xylulose-5-phosphate synthase [Caldicoprobacter faecalis]SFP91510.1 1-deoxy-D-xylulose-5-phosphate synthase [Caldicoprobacter faecalis]